MIFSIVVFWIWLTFRLMCEAVLVIKTDKRMPHDYISVPEKEKKNGKKIAKKDWAIKENGSEFDK